MYVNGVGGERRVGGGGIVQERKWQGRGGAQTQGQAGKYVKSGWRGIRKMERDISSRTPPHHPERGSRGKGRGRGGRGRKEGE
jgi:hypothetical protein